MSNPSLVYEQERPTADVKWFVRVEEDGSYAVRMDNPALTLIATTRKVRSSPFFEREDMERLRGIAEFICEACNTYEGRD